MLENNFWDRTQKPKAIKETTDKMNLKFKTFALQKALLKEKQWIGRKYHNI